MRKEKQTYCGPALETISTMKAGEIAATAAKLVAGDREESHGEKVKNFTNVAYVWNAILQAAGKLKEPLDAHDVGNLMEGMKIARRYSGRVNMDDYIDGAGYAACAGEIAAKMAADIESYKQHMDAALKSKGA